MPKNMVSEGKLGAKGGIAGNERGMRMDIIWGVHSIIYMEMQKNEGKAPAPPLMANTAPCLLGMFYKLVLMEILYLGLTWPLLHFSLASCCISKTHIARYARL